MKKIGKFMLFVFVVLLAALPGCTQDQGRIKITYIGFADTLTLGSNRLNHSFAQNSSTPRAAALQLRPEQEQLFVDWLGRCRVFSLTRPDVMVSEPNHPGAMERSSLQVEYGDKRIELSWGGVSGWNDPARKESLDRAVEELTTLSFRLIREAGLL